MNPWLDHRASALLLHITSLPGPFHKGVIGSEAKTLIDCMSDAGFTVWQFLPLGPTHGHGSPYESLSSFAGNPELIDLRQCVEAGWLNATHLEDPVSMEMHAALLAEAGHRFRQQGHMAELVEFRTRQAYWLEDFSLFSALKRVFQDRAWWQWPAELRDRDENAMSTAREHYDELIQQVIFEQWLFDSQWQSLQAHAREKGVQLFGDLPIYVAHDSADVWATPSLFTINENGLCDEVAGVPPDYFSETGQRWGNPLYCWDRMEADGFQWWTKRVARQLERMQMLRLDHFRGLEAYWAIPGASEDGIIGEWREAPGEALLQTLTDSLGQLPMIAEDLGIITEEVTDLREKFGLPGMKILQFAFGGDKNNPYLPANHEENSVVYTGTHDNDTSMGWFANAGEEERSRALKIMQAEADEMPWAMIECAMASIARLAVIPMQDLLELGTEAKFNTPGTLENNWSWRMQEIPAADSQCWQRAAELNKKHNRIK